MAMEAAFQVPFASVCVCRQSSVSGLGSDVAAVEDAAVGLNTHGEKRTAQALPVCARRNYVRQRDNTPRLLSIRSRSWHQTFRGRGLCYASKASMAESHGTISGYLRLKRGGVDENRSVQQVVFPLWTGIDFIHKQQREPNFGSVNEADVREKMAGSLRRNIDLSCRWLKNNLFPSKNEAKPASGFVRDRQQGNVDIHYSCHDKFNQNIDKDNNLRTFLLFMASTFLILFMGLRLGKPAYAQKAVSPPPASTSISTSTSTATSTSSSSRVEEEIVKDERQNLEQGAVSGEGIEQGKPKKQISDALLKEIEKYLADSSKGSDLPPEVVFETFIDQHPEDVEAHQALLLIYMKKGEAEKALPLIQKLIKLQPNEIEWKYIRAQALDLTGDAVRARKAFEEILKIEPLSARALQGAAITMQKIGDDDRAPIEMLEAAVKRASSQNRFKESRKLRMLLGQILTLQGNLERAFLEYDKLVKEEPDDFRPHLCQGLIYSLKGEWQEAEKKFEEFDKRCPKDFPNRKYLDELATTAKTESRKLKKQG